jgi:hypothetical protein
VLFHYFYAYNSTYPYYSQEAHSNRHQLLLFQYHTEKEIKDSDGNFIILSVRINDTLWTLVAVYGPNNDELQFFTNLQRKIESLGNSSGVL